MSGLVRARRTVLRDIGPRYREVVEDVAARGHSIEVVAYCDERRFEKHVMFKWTDRKDQPCQMSIPFSKISNNDLYKLLVVRLKVSGC